MNIRSAELLQSALQCEPHRHTAENAKDTKRRLKAKKPMKTLCSPCLRGKNNLRPPTPINSMNYCSEWDVYRPDFCHLGRLATLSLSSRTGAGADDDSGRTALGGFLAQVRSNQAFP